MTAESFSTGYSMGSNFGRSRQNILKGKSMVAKSLRQNGLLEGKVTGEGRCGWSVPALTMVVSLT